MLSYVCFPRYDTYTSKLTLSVDDQVISQAKRYAKEHGVSVSKMVEAFLESIAAPAQSAQRTPILRLLRGSLRKTDSGDYKKHLVAKCR